jgi:NADH:ubiquinone oxidoreductase subunit 6 (subunit J)
MLSAVLVAGTVVFAVQAIRASRLLTSALWLAGAGALLSVVLYWYGARQAAVIELSVGAGLVTVLFVFAISIAGEDAIGARPILPKPLAWGLVALSVTLLGWCAVQFAASPIDPAATESSLADMLWQERGLDVLVQVVLIFAGVLGLLGLLAEARPPLEGAAAAEVAARRDRELQTLEQHALAQEREQV